MLSLHPFTVDIFVDAQEQLALVAAEVRDVARVHQDVRIVRGRVKVANALGALGTHIKLCIVCAVQTADTHLVVAIAEPDCFLQELGYFR